MYPQPGARRAAPSPYAAGVLSLLFPGLGQAYVGAWSRALLWAAAPILLLALGLGVVLRLNKFELAGLLAQTWFLSAVFVGNLVLLAYRGAAIVDAWRLARAAEERDLRFRTTGPLGAGGPRVRRSAGGLMRSLSLAGLGAMILVMAGAHVAVARYDLLVSNLLNCVFNTSGTSDCSPAGASGAAGLPADTGQPGISLAPEGSALPIATPPPWTGGRLNILLVGVDQRPGELTFNTDTLIVVSIDPATRRVAMFSIPRDTVDIPLPPGSLQQAFGSSVYGTKVNSIWTTLHDRPDLCPGTTPNARGFNCLKSIIGYFFGLDIQYYAEVNFTGFTQIVNAFGGVTIDVQSPVVDDRYPTDGNGDRRIYIPTGLQHMTGAQALIYARSRHGSNDFDRGARQQRVLTSLLAEANIPAILAHLDELVSAFEQTVHTDIPRELIPQLLGLASQVDTKAIHSFVFAPPLYETEDYVPGVHDLIYPKVGLIRSAVQLAISADPSFEIEREKVAQESATVWVLNGSGRPGLATDLAGYLTYQGFAATAPTQPAATIAGAQIVAFNGAQTSFPESIARLKAIFGVTVITKTDPTVTINIVVTVGRSTPDLTSPPLP
jgi:LCP family protein required for cell wall assembly